RIPLPLLRSMRVLFWTMLPVPATRIPSPPLLWIVAPWSVLLLPISSTPLPRFERTLPPVRTLEEPSTRIPTPLPFNEFQLTLFPSRTIRTRVPAPEERMLFNVCPVPATRHPTEPPAASGPTIVSLPELVMFQTGWVGSRAVTFATVHCVILRVFDPPRLRFSLVLPKIPMTSPLIAAS